MGVFCHRLNFVSTAPPTAVLAKTKADIEKRALIATHLVALKYVMKQSQKVFKPHDHLLRKLQVIKPMCGYIFYHIIVVYDRNHLFGLGSDTETETENWPKLLADTETNQNCTILNWDTQYWVYYIKVSCQSVKEIRKRSAQKYHSFLGSTHI